MFLRIVIVAMCLFQNLFSMNNKRLKIDRKEKTQMLYTISKFDRSSILLFRTNYFNTVYSDMISFMQQHSKNLDTHLC